MAANLSLIPELEEVLQHGTRQKRAEALQRVTALFVNGADHYNEEHIGVFDEVFGLLIEEIEEKARVELSNHLAPLSNAPSKVLRALANDDDIAVAGPILKHAPRLAEADLVSLAKTKSQAHLKAISARPELGEAVTDVLVRRGDRGVVHSVAGNRGARISASAFVNLVSRARDDGALAEKVGLRPDIPEPMFRELLSKATAVVHARLLSSATPDVKTEIWRVLAKVSGEVGARVGPRDYRAAQRLVLSLERAGRLDEAALAAFCSDGKYEEAIVALATLARVPVNIVDRLMGNGRPDPVLLLCKAVGLAWSTVRAIVILRPNGKSSSSQGLDAAFANYGRLSASTAQRVVRFWQVRQK
jgi:uncharacterized protein (DUF2336 family)